MPPMRRPDAQKHKRCLDSLCHSSHTKAKVSSFKTTSKNHRSPTKSTGVLSVVSIMQFIVISGCLNSVKVTKSSRNLGNVSGVFESLKYLSYLAKTLPETLYLKFLD